MRFIGNKTSLLDIIKSFINENVAYNEDMIFCDLFSGTSSVARYFKDYYEIISNDNLYFSYILQKATIENNEIPSFETLKIKLNKKDFNEIKNYLETCSLDELQEEYNILNDELFVFNNYTPSENCERMYFKPETGRRIDLIRIIIDKWLENNWINTEEHTILLALLIESVPYFSNISGVYGAYLKKWDPRTQKPFKFYDFDIKNNNRENKSFNRDAHELIRDIKGDILYLDPPYNHRQYPPNYHVLETLAKYDYPEIKGVSGMRDYSNQISKFCRKREVKGALEDIIENANFQYIVMSYSTDGLLTPDEIKEVFTEYGIANTFKMAKPIEYRKFQSHKTQKKKELHELLFFVEKDV